MSTIVAFSPMNLRLYDKDERELRTYISPVFSCVSSANDPHGLCAHIVADNGGGKSTLLLFLEMVFCKADRSGPNVGKKKAIDYLRRAQFDLHDTTPTTVAVLVRRDDPSVMRQARDIVFGYTVRLRDAEGASLDLRRFVIHLSENPGFGLGQLATDVVYDSSGAPRPQREVWERLRSVAGCRLYESAEWDDYSREMLEAGISPILWRELSKMNRDEEAAGTYFQSSDAFRNIVRLVSEAQEPMSGEKTKPLWEVAANIARQVATQADDRLREARCQQAGDAIQLLAEAVARYADDRESLKVLEDLADEGMDELISLQDETARRVEELRARGGLHDRRRKRNRQMRISRDIARGQAELESRGKNAAVQRDNLDRKQQAHRDATRRVCLDEAARSYKTFRRLDARYGAKKGELEAIRKNIAVDDELRQASIRACANLHAAESGTARAQEEAQANYDGARHALAKSKEAYAQADKILQGLNAQVGAARGTFKSSMSNLQRSIAGVEAMKSAQTTMEGFFSQQTIASLERDAERSLRLATKELDAARRDLARRRSEAEAARTELQQAQIELVEKRGRAHMWSANLATARELDKNLRTALSLWEEAIELAVTGRLKEARTHVEALRDDAILREREASERAGYLKRRLDALEAGRLDMSDQLRGWLDQHAIKARTLASYEGIAAEARSRMFAQNPWLAHVLVVDARTASTLGRMADDRDLSELGHPVFYVCNSDVDAFLNGLGDASEDGGAFGLVRTLHTIEGAYLDDPKSYAERTHAAWELARQRMEEARATERKLDVAREELAVYERFFVEKGFGEGATLADVAAREELCAQELAAGEAHVKACEEALRLAGEHLQASGEACEAAEAEHGLRAREREGLKAVRAHNEECMHAKEVLDAAERERDNADLQRKAAQRAQEDAAAAEAAARDVLDGVLRERSSIAGLRQTLEGLSTVELNVGVQEPIRSCSSEELAASVDALRSIVARNDRTLENVQSELEELRRQREDEKVWRMKLRESKKKGYEISKEELEAWVPSDEVAQDRLYKEEQRAQEQEHEAYLELMEAENVVRRVSEQLDSDFEDLRRTGLQEPLEVPIDYDYALEEAQITADAERDSQELNTAIQDQYRIVSLKSRVSSALQRVERADGYRATQIMEHPSLPDFDAWEEHVQFLEDEAKSRRDAMEAAARELARRKTTAVDDVSSTSEIAAARGVRESVDSVVESCATFESMMRVRRGLDDHALQFKTLSASLRNKLRATDEAVDDLIERAIADGYRLMDELHRLVLVSQVRIKDRGRERTIDFVAGGRSRFRREVRRDEVAKSRLARSVRTLLMEELPGLDDSVRDERAKTRLQPHELVYALLDDRSVQVRYPVIRGGKRMSYESARDVSGSGSTGQKSAGYVMAFLALLRYLGSVGSLSSEQSLFVALENQFGKISSSKIIQDIKEVVDQTHMQLITVAGRELRSAYAMGDVVFTLYRSGSANQNTRGTSRLMRAKVDESDQVTEDAVIDKFRATRQFENLRFDF